MEKRIVVALRRHDRVEELMPYLEDFVRPGAKVVFLVRYPAEPWLYLRDHWISTEFRDQAISASQDLRQRYSCESQRGLAEQRVSSARRYLQELGAEVTVDLWTGSSRKLTEVGSEGVQGGVLIMKAANNLSPSRVLRRTLRFFRKIAQPYDPPVLLFHPSRTA